LSNDSKKELLLPEADEMSKMYNQFNGLYFDHKLPPVKNVEISWSTKMTSSAGSCRVEKKRKGKIIKTRYSIRLSQHYHKKYPEEVTGTLLHEMIHILVPGHGKNFHKWLQHINKLGGRVSRHSREPAASPKWKYICKKCGEKIYRRRQFKGLVSEKYRCRLCGGRWDEYKLR